MRSVPLAAGLRGTVQSLGSPSKLSGTDSSKVISYTVRFDTVLWKVADITRSTGVGGIWATSCTGRASVGGCLALFAANDCSSLYQAIYYL